MLNEFKTFLTKSNALALAVGVIIGAAMGRIVTGLVDDLIMPVVALVLPKGDWRDAQIVLSQSTDATGKVTVNAIKYGHLIGVVIDFLFIALVVFLVTKALIRTADAAPTKTCPYCLEAIPEAATKCKACCTSLA